MSPLQQAQAQQVAIEVRAAREAVLMTQEMLATACDLSERTIRRLEQDGTASFETLRAIAAVLPIDIPSIYRSVAREHVTPGRAMLRIIAWVLIRFGSLWIATAGLFVAYIANARPEWASFANFRGIWAFSGMVTLFAFAILAGLGIGASKDWVIIENWIHEKTAPLRRRIFAGANRPAA